jgi:hypothetical protein
MIWTAGAVKCSDGGGVSQAGVGGDSGRGGIDFSTSKVPDNLLEAEEAIDIDPRLGRPLDFLIAPTGEDERGLG